MLEKEEIIHLIALIENRYCFNENLTIWKEVKKKLLKLVSGGECSVNEIDECLSVMGDMHLRVYKIQKPQKVNQLVIEYIDDKLFLLEDKRRKEIVTINHMVIEEILEKYKKRYPMFSKRFLLNQVIQDIKFCEANFNKQNLVVETTDGTRRESEAEELENIRNTAPVKMLNMLKPIFSIPIDEDTVLIKLTTFSLKDIDLLFKETIEDKVVQEAQNIIFDVRDNPGGKIELTKKIVSYIIPSDIDYPFYIKNNVGEVQHINIRAEQEKVFQNKRLFVFLNGNTMSSSEFIFATGLKTAFKNQIVIIGETTFGLSGQASTHQLGNEGMFYLTEKRYFTYDDKEILQGIEPDYRIEVQMQLNACEDGYVSWYKNKKGKI